MSGNSSISCPYLLMPNCTLIESNSSYSNETLPGRQDANGNKLSTPLYIGVTVTLVYVIILILGVAGNGLCVFVICHQREMKTATNLFLMNLSVADLLVLVVCMPSSLMEFYTEEVWYLGDGMCKFLPWLENTVAHASILTILAISFERFYAICFPFKAQYTCSKSRTAKIVTIVWICAVVSALPFIFMAYTQRATFHDGSMVTVCRTPINNGLKKIYLFASFAVFFLIPLLILVILYTAIGHQLSRESKLLRITQDANAQALFKTRQQVVYMLLVIIFLFFVCLLPIRIFSSWIIFSSAKQINALGLEGYLNVSYTARVMLYTNSAVNPILYNIMSTKFRNAFKKVICGNRARVQRQNTFTSRTIQMTHYFDNADQGEEAQVIISLREPQNDV